MVIVVISKVLNYYLVMHLQRAFYCIGCIITQGGIHGNGLSIKLMSSFRHLCHSLIVPELNQLVQCFGITCLH